VLEIVLGLSGLLTKFLVRQILLRVPCLSSKTIVSSVYINELADFEFALGYDKNIYTVVTFPAHVLAPYTIHLCNAQMQCVKHVSRQKF